MDDITKGFIKILMERQQTQSEQSLAMMKLFVNFLKASSDQLKAVGEAIVVASRIDDDASRRSLLDSIWSQLSDSEVQKQQASLIARAETFHEHLAAQIQSTLDALESYGGDENL